MVKVKLIENDSYFQLRKKQLIILFLASIPPLLVLNLHGPAVWIFAAFAIYILGLYFIGKNQKRISEVFGNRTMEMDDSEIRLTSKKRNQYESMVLDGKEVIILDKDFTNQESAFSEKSINIDGKALAHSITIRKGGFERKLQFELDSHYMASQLKKVIEAWKSKGYQIVQPQTAIVSNNSL